MLFVQPAGTPMCSVCQLCNEQQHSNSAHEAANSRPPGTALIATPFPPLGSYGAVLTTQGILLLQCPRLHVTLPCCKDVDSAFAVLSLSPCFRDFDSAFTAAAVFHCCRDVDSALAAEAGAGRRGLHLVVMGHVDAGKSTLMGRLLHELGQVSQKEVHKNQRESAQAGKVGVLFDAAASAYILYVCIAETAFQGSAGCVHMVLVACESWLVVGTISMFSIVSSSSSLLAVLAFQQIGAVSSSQAQSVWTSVPHTASRTAVCLRYVAGPERCTNCQRWGPHCTALYALQLSLCFSDRHCLMLHAYPIVLLALVLPAHTGIFLLGLGAR